MRKVSQMWTQELSLVGRAETSRSWGRMFQAEEAASGRNVEPREHARCGGGGLRAVRGVNMGRGHIIGFPGRDLGEMGRHCRASSEGRLQSGVSTRRTEVTMWGQCLERREDL